jgi:hypothetical protein
MISFYRLEGEKLSPAAQAVAHLKHFNAGMIAWFWH